MKQQLDEVLSDIYSADFVQAFDEIEIGEAANSTDLDKVTEQYLGQDLSDKLSDVDVKDETFAFNLTTRHRRISLIAKGKWLFVTAILAAMTIVALLLGTDTAVTFLKAIR
jgi:hypothetical protein